MDLVQDALRVFKRRRPDNGPQLVRAPAATSAMKASARTIPRSVKGYSRNRVASAMKRVEENVSAFNTRGKPGLLRVRPQGGWTSASAGPLSLEEDAPTALTSSGV